MTLHKFQLLEPGERLAVIVAQAKYLSERIDGAYTYKLHQLGTFYIEEEWHHVFNERRNFVAFISDERLKLYTGLPDLSSNI